MTDHCEDRLVIEAYGATDVGMKRRLNEDVFLVNAEAGVFLVADGMGGHAAGEVASKLAAEEISAVYSSRADETSDLTWPEHWNMARSAAANILTDAVLAGHDRVTEAVTADENLKGMGTTVVAAARAPACNKMVICHVGDSRAYRLRQGTLEILTNDHSWVHEQVAAGFLTEEAARSHPLKNVVTQALGGSTEPKVDVLETEMEEKDLYLLCSDGLNSMLTDDEIQDILKQSDDLNDLGTKLIVAANEQGGNDNISVVLLRSSQSTT